MFDVNSVGGIAQRLEHLSEEFRQALDQADGASAMATSSQAQSLLAEAARLVRRAHEQGRLTIPPDPVGIVWADASASWHQWEPTYQAPYETYADARFTPLNLRDGLNKILHAGSMTFRVTPDRHELVLAGDLKPFQPEGRRKPWLAVVSVSQVTTLMQAHRALAELRRQ